MSVNESGRYELLNRLSDEYMERMRRGEGPTVEEYCARYPDLAEDIGDLFAAVAEIGQVEVDLRETQAPAEAEVGAEGRRVGDYQILREVGRGGMGVVYEAEQTSLGRRVALKILPLSGSRDGKALERFRREARAAAKMHHTNIVPVFEVGQDGDAYFYAMQFIQGQSLDQVIRELCRLHDEMEETERSKAGKSRPRGSRQRSTVPDPSVTPRLSQVALSLMTEHFERPDKVLNRVLAKGSTTVGPVPAESRTSGGMTTLPQRAEDRGLGLELATLSPPGPPSGSMDASILEPTKRHFYRSVAEIGLQTTHALAYAHARGLIHRDIKPSNLLLDAAGIVWVTDFGLAKLVDEQGAGLTQTGDIVGTLRYMAPERFNGTCDVRSDLYALGLTLYELLLLRPAFEAANRLELMDRIQRQVPAPPRRLDRQIPRDLETIILKAIEREPKQRYQTAEEMTEDLRRYLAGEPIQARPVTASERVVKWARRKPAIAGLAAAVLLVSALGLGGVVGQWRRAVAREHEAKLARAEAEVQRDHATQANLALQTTMGRLQRNVYLANLNLAQRYWSDNNTSRSAELLDGLWPHSPGQIDLRGFEWHYLDRLCHSDLLTFTGHTGFVWNVSFSPDGKRAVSASEDATVQVWDPDTGQPSLQFREHHGPVHCVRFSPDGTRIASAGFDGIVRVWESDTGRPIWNLTGHATQRQKDGVVKHLHISSVAFHPGGNQLASTSSDGTVKTWDLTRGRELCTFREHREYPYAVAYSPDGSFVASADVGKEILLWEPDSGKVRHRIKTNTYILSIAIDRAGKWVAAPADDHTVTIWDCATGATVRSFAAHKARPLSVAFSPDGASLATGSEDRLINIWGIATGRLLHTIQGHQSEVRDLAFRPGTKLLASASADGTVKLWDSTLGQDPRTLETPNAWVRSLAFSPRGDLLASGSDDGVIRFWNPLTGQELNAFGSRSGMRSLAFFPDGKLLATYGEGGLVRIWNVEQRKEVRAPLFAQEIKRQLTPRYCVAVSPDGKTIAAAGDMRTVQLWDIASGTLLYKLTGHENLVLGVAFHPSGKTLATASLDGTARLWELDTGQSIGILRGHKGAIWGVEFHPGGQLVATASEDRTVKLWDLAAETEILTLKGHGDQVFQACFTADGKRIVTGSFDRTVRVWETDGGQEMLVLRGHTEEVSRVAICPDDMLIASGGAGPYHQTMGCTLPAASLHTFRLSPPALTACRGRERGRD